MPTSDEVIRLLTSIDASLKALVARASGRPEIVGGPVKPTAPDSDLDSQYGDPEVRQKDPRDWTGQAMKGRHFSECPPEYLDLLAEMLDYFGDKAEASGEQVNGKPRAPYLRKDAARARGWARRLRAGWKASDTSGAFAPQEQSNLSQWPGNDDYPF